MQFDRIVCLIRLEALYTCLSTRLSTDFVDKVQKKWRLSVYCADGSVTELHNTVGTLTGAWR